MSERATAIMDAAEFRIRAVGISGFSFREIADDIGIKSASVHHHFPTKSDLVAATVARYQQRFADFVEEEERQGLSRVAAWRKGFRNSIVSDGRMCLCGILASEMDALSREAAEEVVKFFQAGVKSLSEFAPKEFSEPQQFALEVLAVLEGGLILARAFNDVTKFDQATAGLERFG